jgi:lipid-binding SYLF domain-containing protein
MLMASGCSTAPRTLAERRSLVDEAEATVDMMIAKDPSLRGVIDRSAGFAVYPDVGAAGAVVGGAYGRGVLFERGRPVGFTELNQGAVGALIGGQTYSQLVVFHEEAALNRLKAGNIDIGAEASAVLLKAGVAAATRAEGGFSIFQVPKGGLMASAAVTGQKINYQPMHRSYEVEGAVTAGGNTRGDRSNGSDLTSGKGGKSGEASAYQVDQNLQPHEQIKLRTGEAALESAREAANDQQK